MALAFIPSSSDRDCPVESSKLAELYRAGPGRIAELVTDMPEDRRILLALYCYGRAHLRNVALTVAATCAADRLGLVAGTMGEVLASQSRREGSSFGGEAGKLPLRPRVSLAGGACA